MAWGKALTDVDICDILLWKVSMTLSRAMEDHEHFSPILPQCTPDAVALLGWMGRKYWKERKAYISNAYEGGSDHHLTKR